MGTIARMQAAVSALPDGPVKRDLQRAVTEVIELREAADVVRAISARKHDAWERLEKAFEEMKS